MTAKLVRRKVVDSTNDEAKALIAEGAEPWTAVVAEKQLAGKGRYGRFWASPRGGLYVSLILQGDMEQTPLLSMAAAVAVVEAVERLGLEASAKWPNDVHLRGAKVAGILVEGLVGPEAYWAVVGIGINSDFPLRKLPAHVAPRATTLRHELRASVDNEELLRALLDALRLYVGQLGDPPAIVQAYGDRCTTLNRDVVVETGDGIVRGTAVGLDTSGMLRVRKDSGEEVEVAEGTVLEEG